MSNIAQRPSLDQIYVAPESQWRQMATLAGVEDFRFIEIMRAKRQASKANAKAKKKHRKRQSPSTSKRNFRASNVIGTAMIEMIDRVNVSEAI